MLSLHYSVRLTVRCVLRTPRASLVEYAAHGVDGVTDERLLGLLRLVAHEDRLPEGARRVSVPPLTTTTDSAATRWRAWPRVFSSNATRTTPSRRVSTRAYVSVAQW